MRKKLFSVVIILSFLLFCVGYSGLSYNLSRSYKFSEDFTKISVSFYNDTATSRGFSFFTRFGEYEDNCDVQLDLARHEEHTPFFKDSDNIYIKAQSESTSYVFPIELRHYALAENLLPGRKYFYRVGSKNLNKWSKWGYFITDDKDSSFSFLHITDSQAQTEDEFEWVKKSLYKAYETTGVPEFILTTGDLVELGINAAEWNMYFGALQDLFLQTTQTPVSGNHELFPQPIYYHFYLNTQKNRISYSFEYGNALFVIFDTNDYSLTAQTEWLKNILNNSDKQWKIVAFHKAPFSSGTHADDIDVINIRNKVVPVLAQCGVDLVLNGHDHIYCRTYPINEDGDLAGYENKISTANDIYTKTTYINPYGPIYVINRCIGIKFYNKSKSFNDHLIEKGDSQKITKPVFSNVQISGNTLIYTAYEYDRNDTRQVSIIDLFEIVK